MSSSVVLTSPLSLIVPIIKVVGDSCNLRCRYCFSHGRDRSIFRIMTDDLIEKFITQYMEIFSGHLLFIWHGGEPLLAGLSFFQKVVDLQTKNLKNTQTVHNAIQTNATLINEDWAEFFKHYDFNVGVSLDGDKESHNRFRVRPNGDGSFDAVIQGIEILRKYEIEPGIIQTLTHDNLARVKENFKFFVDNLGIKSWSINPYCDVKRKMLSHQVVTSDDFAVFLKNVINLWLEYDDSNIRIREIENFGAGALDKLAFGCEFNGSCGDFFCVEYNGKIYPCDRLCDSEFIWGDLAEESLRESLGGYRRLKYKESVSSTHPECVGCEWQRACHNGCPYHRIGGIRGKYYFCEMRKTIFSYLGNKIKEHKSQKGENNGTGKEKSTTRPN